MDHKSPEGISLLGCDLFSELSEAKAAALRRIPKSPDDYSNPRYWQERYSAEEGISYDWYGCSFDDFWSQAREACPSGTPLMALEVGSGNSEWSRLAAGKGWQVTSTDIDWGVLCAQDKHDSKAMEKLAVDARRLPFKGSCFDVAFEKGTLDAISCGSSGQSEVASVAQELLRCLKAGGVFLIVTAKEPSHLLDTFSEVRIKSADETDAYGWQQRPSVSKGGVWIVVLVKEIS